MAVARRKAIENRERIAKLISRRAPAGIVVRSDDGRMFFLTSKDERRTKLSARDARVVETIQSRRSRGKAKTSANPTGCSKTLRWLLSHNPKTPAWKKVSVWWMKNC